MKSNSIFKMLFCSLVLIACGNANQSDKTGNSNGANYKAINTENAAFSFAENRIGPVKIGYTVEELTQAVGAKNVTIDSFYVGEGEYVPGGKVFKGETVEIEFKLEDNKVSALRIQHKNSPYKNGKGLKIGTTIKELIKINGTDIVFYGFEWDYGGTIMSYAGGALANMPKKINLRLQYNCRPEAVVKFLGMDKYSSNVVPKELYDSIYVSMITIR